LSPLRSLLEYLSFKIVSHVSSWKSYMEFFGFERKKTSIWPCQDEVLNKVANRFVIANFPMYVSHNSFDLNMDKWFRGQSIDRITCNIHFQWSKWDGDWRQNVPPKILNPSQQFVTD
jgi:hypothetical protein